MNIKSNEPADEMPSTPVPVVPSAVSVGNGEGVAEQYVTDELKKARVNLRKTQIGSAITLVALLLYMGIMTYRVLQYAQPDQAAEVASGLIAERVNSSASDLADQFKTKIPEVMQQLPDQAIQKMPEFRNALISRVETDLRTNSAQSSAEMGRHFDEFLTANKDQIKTVMDVGADKSALKSIGPAMQSEIMSYLATKPEQGGDSVKDSIDKSLSMLHSIKAETDTLVMNKNLTPDQRKTRRAIAIIMQTVNKGTQGLDLKQAVLDKTNIGVPSTP